VADKLSISRAWDETREIFRRDGSLLVSVALALIVLPEVVVGLIDPRTGSAEAASWMVQLLRFAAGLITLIGQLALIRLALGPSTTVGDAIRHGAKRFPYAVGAIVLLFVLLAIIVIPTVALVAWATGADLTRMAGGAPPTGPEALIILFVVLFALALSVRFTLTSPVASAEPVGPIIIVKRSWALTRSHYWRMLGLVALLLVAALVLLMAAGIVGGILARLISQDIEPFSVAALIVALLGGIAQGAFSVLASVMLARTYAQLAGRDVQPTVPSSGT
jgi:hypothetical protein